MRPHQVVPRWRKLQHEEWNGCRPLHLERTKHWHSLGLSRIDANCLKIYPTDPPSSFNRYRADQLEKSRLLVLSHWTTCFSNSYVNSCQFSTIDVQQEILYVPTNTFLTVDFPTPASRASARSLYAGFSFFSRAKASAANVSLKFNKMIILTKTC